LSARAGVCVATVFRHCPTKERVIEAALLRHPDELREQANTFAGESHPRAWRTLVGRYRRPPSP